MRGPETIDYDQKGHDELLVIAKERGVGDLEIYRKTELKRLLRAMDDKDDAVVIEVREVALERTKRQSANANRIADKAKANAGRPLADKPSADKASVQAGGKPQDGASELLLVEEEVAPPRPPIFQEGSENTGSMLVARVLARAQAIKDATKKAEAPKQSLAARALEMAKAAGQTGKAFKGEDVPVFEVLETTRHHSLQGTFHLAAGSFVTERTHDLASLRMQGAKLRQIDPTKVGIVYSELGHPIAMKTQPMPEPVAASQQSRKAG